MQELRNYLASLPTGPIAAPAHLKRLLASCWNDFEGSHRENMKADKLGNRQMEEVGWEPPILSFTIERYRVTLLGATQKERHRWEVNVGTKEAICYNPEFRRIQPRPPPRNVDPIVKEVVRLIKSHQETEWLRWNKNGSVRVVIGKVLPVLTNFNKHLTWQRERFRAKVDERLTTAGWMKIRNNHYAPTNPTLH